MSSPVVHIQRNRYQRQSSLDTMKKEAAKQDYEAGFVREYRLPPTHHHDICISEFDHQQHYNLSWAKNMSESSKNLLEDDESLDPIEEVHLFMPNAKVMKTDIEGMFAIF